MQSLYIQEESLITISIPLRFKEKVENFIQQLEEEELDKELEIAINASNSNNDNDRDDIILSDDQARAFDELKAFHENDEKHIVLKGFAGTGKTFLLCHFLKWVKSQNSSFNIVASALSNKATKNLDNMANKTPGLELETKTIAQLLGQQPELDKKTGEEYFTGDVPDLNLYDYIVIDEFSMIDKSTVDKILDSTNYGEVKVIFVGDIAQLPPINEEQSSVLNIVEKQLSLNKIVRYDGDLVTMSEKIRTGRFNYNFTNSNDGKIKVYSWNNKQSKENWIDRGIELFQKDSKNVKFLAWRNKTVSNINWYIRRKLWGENAPKFVVGERVITYSPLFRTKPGDKGKNKFGIIVNNSTEAVVLQEPVEAYVEFSIDRVVDFYYYKIEVLFEDSDKPVKLFVLREDQKEKYDNTLRYLSNKKQWNKYYSIKKYFDNIQYAYAITTHKAQGSTINNTFIHLKDMMDSQERNKLIYTAFTRSSDSCHILQ